MLKPTKQSSDQKGNPKLPLVIVNPKSAGGATKGNWSGIASDLRAHFGAFQVAFTKKQGDGITLAKQAAENGREFIIACGGDCRFLISAISRLINLTIAALELLFHNLLNT